MRLLTGVTRIASRSAAVLVISAGLAAAFLNPGIVTRGTVLPQAWAEGEWSAEFEAVCSKTQDAMALSNDELRTLVTRCDALKPRIDALDESRRKVYGKRLQLCRDLYEFVLQSRDKG